MTLKEAHDSGRNYFRVEWLDTDMGIGRFHELSDISLEDAIADDYELEPIPERVVTITARDLNQAWTRALNSGTFPIKVALMEELGLGE